MRRRPRAGGGGGRSPCSSQPMRRRPRPEGRGVRNVGIIASRELRHYFISPMAYVLAFLLYLILGGLFAINVYFGLQPGQGSPDGRLVIGPMVPILILTT